MCTDFFLYIAVLFKFWGSASPSFAVSREFQRARKLCQSARPPGYRWGITLYINCSLVFECKWLLRSVTPCTDAYRSSLSTSDLQGVSGRKSSWLPYKRTGAAIAHFRQTQSRPLSQPLQRLPHSPSKSLVNTHAVCSFEQTPLHQKVGSIQKVLSTLLPTASWREAPNPLSTF